MSTQIFVNVAVKDLDKSKAFFRQLGYDFNADFTNDDGACMVISDTIYVMLLREPFFQTFTDKTICDARTHVEVLTALSVDSRAKVDEIIEKAVAAGGTTPRAPQDYGFMYSRSFDDLDGHTWEFVHMSGEPPKE
ncbi:MAG TPA: VOC family protein [Tahibacter sp.]|uniref:VOC family protein n=1 Tax=Tahibacter sp. TaxID=2056211 RepID=UPI002D160510|nr:VOC family protein [Tahibacter sp.]HSX58785.1 VOC family protein [Tahibacter sp.]